MSGLGLSIDYTKSSNAKGTYTTNHNTDYTCSICERVFTPGEARELTETAVGSSTNGYRLYIEEIEGRAHYLRIPRPKDE